MSTPNPWTRHGHRIQSLPDDGTYPRPPVARCGGPGLCRQCSLEVVQSFTIRPALHPFDLDREIVWIAQHVMAAHENEHGEEIFPADAMKLIRKRAKHLIRTLTPPEGK